MAASVGMIAALACPLAASAKTVVVDSNGPSGACVGTAPTYRTLTDASSSVTLPGDAVEVRPKGSYLLYATAVNRAGVAQTTFSPTAGNVVAFKVK